MDDRRLTLRGVSSAHPDHPPSGLEIVSGASEYQRGTGEVPEAEWSGRDQNNRLVFAMRGSIFVRTGGRDVELATFATWPPDPSPPSEWATRPLL